MRTHKNNIRLDMQQTFKGEKRNGEDSSPVSVWTFTDKGVEIQNGTILFIPYTKIVCFTINSKDLTSVRDPFAHYYIQLHISRVTTRSINSTSIDINFSNSDYGKSCVEKITELLMTKIG